MLRVVDLVYHSHNDYDKPQQVLEKHAPATGFAEFIKDRIDIQFVKHLNYEGSETINDIKYTFFKGKNNFWYIPVKTHRYIKKQQPDIVMVEGLIFPLQLMMLKLLFGSKTKVIAQHHGEKPYPGIKGFFQKLADYFVSLYLFTSCDDAKDWKIKKVINDLGKCREVPEASTYFTRQEKEKSKLKVGMAGDLNFISVGRLNIGKDPITVIKGFGKYVAENPGAKLYVIHSDNDQLQEMKSIVDESTRLKNAVHFIGKVQHSELVHWYSAADFYLSGSHREASSYALMEAMHCGCIPVITNIPSFRKMTGDGEYGFLYEVGNATELCGVINGIEKSSLPQLSVRVQRYAQTHLSFQHIADKLYGVFTSIHKET